MKAYIFFYSLLLLCSFPGLAQDLPPCIQALNSSSDLTKKTFVKVVNLKGNRIVYEFVIKSVRQCIDCTNGTIFYDKNCNVAGSFTIGRTASGYVAHGYTAEELGKAGFPNIQYGQKHDTIPPCISKAILQEDSLHNAGVLKITLVSLKGNTFYYFEHPPEKAIANCKDCITYFVYYDANCSPAVRFTVGGIAGTKGSNGYTSADFYNKRTLQILWTATQTSKTGKFLHP